MSELSGMFRDFSSTLKNASFRKHLVMYLGALTTFDVFSAVFILLVTISMNRPIEFGRDVLTTVQLSQFIGLPIATWLCVRFSNSVAYAVSAVSFAGSIHRHRAHARRCVIPSDGNRRAFLPASA